MVQRTELTLNNRMAIKIVTADEAKRMMELCGRYHEAYAEVAGLANEDYICDNSGVAIPKDTHCVAILVLPTVKHYNYQHQLNMLGNYVH